MPRATAVTRRLAVKAEKIIDTVELGHKDRNSRQAILTGTKGTQIQLDLEKATALKDGDALKLEDGSLVQVRAAPEKLLEIRSENPVRLLKAAWHLGGQHASTEMAADALYLLEDSGLEEMLRGLGVTIAHAERPFEPERGGHEGHSHHEHHDHGRHHDHGHDADSGCGHDHHGYDHGHKHG